MTFITIVQKPLVQIAILLALVWLAFGNVLNGYFLADDIWQVGYVADIASGHWDVLWKNFSGNFLEIPSSALYRPLVVLSMVIDFLLWRVAAAGWYVTNLGFYAADVILVWLIARLLFPAHKLAPLVAAAVFAVYPLHAEPVCWLAGRSDLICVCWSLLVLYLAFLAPLCKLFWQRVAVQIAALVCFCLALLSKEMAVMLPVILACWGFVFGLGKDSAAEPNLLHRLKCALKVSWIYWVVLLFYFILRWNCLGTLGGGYTDSLLLTMQQTFWSRLLDWKTLYRLIFPFSAAAGDKAILLAVCYAYIVFGLRYTNRKFAMFLLLWMMAALLPIIPMWGLGSNLEASRIYFFASVPFCLLLSLGIAGIKNIRWQLVCFVVVAAVWLVSARAMCGNWVEAGKEVKAVAQQSLKLSADTPGRLAIFPLPKERNGALLITNGGMFLHLLRPPYQDRSYAERFVVFDRLFTEPAEVINSQRFKSEMAASDVSGPYLWSDNRFQLIPLNRESVQAGKAQFANRDFTIVRRPGAQVEITNLQLNPLSVDFVKVELTDSKKKRTPYAMASWNGNEHDAAVGSAIGFSDKDEPSAITIPVAHYWRWYAQPEIKSIKISLPPESQATVTDVKVLSAREVVPDVRFIAREYKPLGTYYFTRGKAMIAVDCSNIKNADGCVIEISKCNQLFDSFVGDSHSQAVMKRIKLSGKKCSWTLRSEEFPSPGYYQFRCRALLVTGSFLGQWSEPLTLYK